MALIVEEGARRQGRLQLLAAGKGKEKVLLYNLQKGVQPYSIWIAACVELLIYRLHNKFGLF